MTATINRLKLFKWKAIITFFGTFSASLGGAFTTSNAATTWQNWVVAALLAFGVACTATLALFVQLEKSIAIEDEPANPPAP